VCLDKTTTGDGIIAALQVLAVMVKQEKTLEQLCEGITLLPQTLVNLKTDHASMLAAHPDVIKAVDRLRGKLEDNGRVLLRPSGTEPVLRVMVEGTDMNDVERHAEELTGEIKDIEQQLKNKETCRL
jgi:phosphoglucosamine mutase